MIKPVKKDIKKVLEERRKEERFKRDNHNAVSNNKFAPSVAVSQQITTTKTEKKKKRCNT